MPPVVTSAESAPLPRNRYTSLIGCWASATTAARSSVDSAGRSAGQQPRDVDAGLGQERVELLEPELAGQRRRQRAVERGQVGLGRRAVAVVGDEVVDIEALHGRRSARGSGLAS